MSKERALLNLCAVTLKARNICPLLLKDISELLAQPEPTSEPVAWGVYDPDSDMLISIYGYKERPDKVLKERFEWVKLYTAPPKREPLSTDTMLRLITEHRDFPLNLVRAVEKAHGIGGGE